MSLLMVYAALWKVLNTKSSVHHVCRGGGWNIDRTLRKGNNLYFKHFKQATFKTNNNNNNKNSS